jgi:hypothetical protein
VTAQVRSDSLVVIGRYAGDQGIRIQVAVVAGLAAGTGVGFLLTQAAFESSSMWVLLGASFVWAAFMFGGLGAGALLVKRHALKTAPFAEVTFPLRSVDLMGHGPSADPVEGTPVAVLSQPLADWLTQHLSGPREVMLVAPTKKKGRQIMRIVMVDAASAEAFRFAMQTAKSAASQQAHRAGAASAVLMSAPERGSCANRSTDH